MDLYIYSDESGVFDKENNEYYVYGGLIFIGQESRDNYGRKYIGAEKNIAKSYKRGMELKANKISNKHKAKLYKIIKPCIKFGAIIEQEGVNDNIFTDKKRKQRYLDYVYKLSLKNAFLQMERNGLVNLSEIETMKVYVDQHTTATDGRYELHEALLQEFKEGTTNFEYNTFFPPICRNLKSLNLQYCNSSKQPLIRAADIFANRLYFSVVSGRGAYIESDTFIRTFSYK